MFIVIELEPYGKKPTIERVYGPFSESAASDFVDRYCEHHAVNREQVLDDGELKIEKLCGTKP